MNIQDTALAAIKDALIRGIIEAGAATRETALTSFFDLFERCIGDLEREGRLMIEPDSFGESHLDRFIVSATRA